MSINKKNTKQNKHVFFKRSGGAKKVLKPRKKASSLVPNIDPDELGKTINVQDFREDSASKILTSAPKQETSSDPEKDEIRRTINESVSRLSHSINENNHETDHKAQVKKSPDEFNGVDSQEERETLHNAEAVSYQKKAAKLAHEIELLKHEFESEKKHLEHTVRELKKELHRTAPLHDNKFFSLSKQLRSSLEEIENLVDPNIKPEDINAILATQSAELSPQTQTANQAPLPPQQPVPQTVTAPTPPPEPAAAPTVIVEPKKIVTTDPEQKPKKKIEKKLLITAISLLFVLSSGGIVSYNLVKKPVVDQALVDSYLENQGQVQGATSGREPKIDRYEEVTFDDSKWANFNDPIFGISFQYPENVVEKQKNGNGIAFLRKDGFLFKFQEIITPDTPKQYWDKNKDDGQMYTVEEVKFKGRDAISLVLKEKKEYSGNRYLVKVGDGILDIWYTTDDTHFNEDDLKRTQKIIDTINFIE